MDEINFPRYNDLPPRFLFFSVDQTVVFSTALVFGAMGGYLLTAVVLGGTLAYLLGRWRNSRPDGYLQHMLAWYGLLPIKARTALNPFIRLIYPN